MQGLCFRFKSHVSDSQRFAKLPAWGVFPTTLIQIVASKPPAIPTRSLSSSNFVPTGDDIPDWNLFQLYSTGTMLADVQEGNITETMFEIGATPRCAPLYWAFHQKSCRTGSCWVQVTLHRSSGFFTVIQRASRINERRQRLTNSFLTTRGKEECPAQNWATDYGSRTT